MNREFYNKTMQEYADKPLREQVIMTLRKAIMTGRLKAGERMLEISLSETMGVSRTPVREAIRKLEMEGLIDLIPHRGTYVAQISEKRMRDVLEVRRALEGLAVSRAVRRISDEEIEKLHQAEIVFENEIARQDSITTKEKVNRLVEEDVAFHDIILNATGNERLIAIMNNLSDQMYRYRFECLRDQSTYEELVADHRRIMECIEKRDEDKAVACMQEHIDRQAEFIVELMVRDRK